MEAAKVYSSTNNFKNNSECTAESELETKMLGAPVDPELHKLFKMEALKRNESMQEAIRHAALMYISAGGGNT
ncbi:hypothetical protein D3C74_235560 [compost metagenome]